MTIKRLQENGLFKFHFLLHYRVDAFSPDCTRGNPTSNLFVIILSQLNLLLNYLFEEVDWEDCEYRGTAIPLRLLGDVPPENKEHWLDWLAIQEEVYEDEIAATWRA